jgi:biopolymer transport protein ExbB
MAWSTFYLRLVAFALAVWLQGGTIALVHAEETPPAITPNNTTAEEPLAPKNDTSSDIIKDSSVRHPFMLWELFQRGGWSMYAILLCVIAGVAFFFERAFDLRRRRHAPKDFEKDLVHVVDTRGVDLGLALCLDKPSSIARVLYGALLRYGSPRPELEMAVKDEVRRLQYDLRRNSRLVLLMALLAPAIGLMASTAGVISALDTGIFWSELFATALIPFCFGAGVLVVFIPLFAYSRFKADDLAREIEEKSIDALISLDRKAKRSIRQIEDVEEALETKTMPAAKDPFAPIKTPDQPAPTEKKPEPEKIPPAQPVEAAADFTLPWNLDAELHNEDVETSIKTGIATPAHPIKLGVAANPHGSAARLAAASANAGKGSGLMRISSKHEPLPPVKDKETPTTEVPKQAS